MLCKGSERRSPSLLLYKRDSGWVLSSDVRPGCCRMALTGLAIASLAHLQPPLGEVRSPQSSSGHAKTRMHTAQSGAASAPLPCRPVPVRNTEQSTQTASASVCLVSAHSPWTQHWASSCLPARPSSRSRPRLLEDPPLGLGHGHGHGRAGSHPLQLTSGFCPISLPPPFIYQA